MGKRFKRALACMVVVVMCVCGLPVGEIGTKASAVDYEVGDIIEFGNYPQSRVYGALISQLNATSTPWISYNYYSGTGNLSDGKMQPSDYMQYRDVDLGSSRYRAVKFTQYRPYWTGYTHSSVNSYQDDNDYYVNNTYWFKYEPLKWRVLDPSTGLIMCESIIDSQAYQNTVYYYSNYYYQDTTKTTYANDYAKSSIRDWLNDDFYNTVFSAGQKSNIKTTTLNNDCYSSSYPQYNSASTKDKIFLLSHDEAKTSAYGFSSNALTYDIARRAQGTDYAKCQGLYVYRSSSSSSTYNGNSPWWLRSPNYSSDYACEVTSYGYSNNANIVSSTCDGVRPACKLAELKSDTELSEWVSSEDEKDDTYSETYGWCLTNDSYSYGYPENYRIPWSRYFDLYGYNISSLVTTPLSQIKPWNGNCFGLALLSAANYYGLIDLSTYFSNSGKYLYDYGYEKIHTTDSNEQCFSVEGNEAIIETIENAFISQDSVEFSKCEVFENNSDYSKLIEHFTNGTGSPIIVNMASTGDGHTMVLTNDFKPKDIGDGWYCLSAYDSNSPKNSDKLSNPTKEYKRSDSYLLINPTTTEWQYYANDKIQFGSKYHALLQVGTGNLTGRSIWFYDVSLLDKSYFTSTLNLWYKKIQLNIFGSNIKVLDSTNDKTLLKITNGEVEYIADNCEYKVRFNSNFENNITSGTFYTDDYTKLKVISEDSEVLAMSEKTFFSAQPNNAEIIFDFDEATITAICKDNSNDKIEIAAQNIEADYAVKVQSNIIDGNTLSLSVKDDDSSTIEADSINTHIETETDGIDDKNIDIIYNEIPHQHSYSSKITKQPSCTEKGETTYTCSLCGDTYTEVIPPMLNHTDNNNDGKCDICGSDIVASNPSDTCDHICHKGGFAG
ncbi:MAG: DUF6273 domain-containing protein, partial [Ruminococcus sp.]|nr:DUF6273 domain-containing protein [Ruminococcus sp.]